ncbi:MAG: proteasome assembly chaperone family protein [Candidatus Aenigmarchaeota archaeon]|nr:proteasome assembly chaperone family protein [Candidatus Aenigmarchaeota archaeon]
METKITTLERPKLNNPVMVEGLPGIGNVGRVAAGYLIDQTKAVKFAELHSSHFLPFVLVHDNSEVALLKNEFYYIKGKKKGVRDIIILIGDAQSLDQVGHYEIAEKILDFVEGFGCKEIYTLGGLGTGQLETQKPKVFGAVSSQKLKKKLDGYGVDFSVASKVGTIVGASGLLVGLGKLRGMDGVCLMGETAGFPIVTDPKSAESVLKVLMKILGLNIDLEALDERVKEMETFINKIESLQRKAVEEMSKGIQKEGKDDLRYIG